MNWIDAKPGSRRVSGPVIRMIISFSAISASLRPPVNFGTAKTYDTAVPPYHVPVPQMPSWIWPPARTLTAPYPPLDFLLNFL
jgi:hypothetical protein